MSARANIETRAFLRAAFDIETRAEAIHNIPAEHHPECKRWNYEQQDNGHYESDGACSLCLVIEAATTRHPYTCPARCYDCANEGREPVRP